MRCVVLAIVVVCIVSAAPLAQRKRYPLTSLRRKVDLPLLPDASKHMAYRAPGTNPLIVVPVYGAGFTGNASTAVYARSVMDTAVAFYAQHVFTVTPITFNVVIRNMGAGLGQSTAAYLNLPYNTFSAALVSHSPLALAAGVAGSVEPVTGSSTINAKTTVLRTLGLLGASTQSFCNQTGLLDGCIEVNLALTDVAGGGDGSNSLLTTILHEINEVIGMGSGLPDPGDIFPSDLYRWASPGVRSYATNPSTTEPCTATPRAYFSPSATGAMGTNLSDFNNCQNGGDYGDWATVSPPVDLVNNAFSTGGASVMMVGNPESINLELLGYTITGTNAPTAAPTTAAPTTAAPPTTAPPPTTAAPTAPPTTTTTTTSTTTTTTTTASTTTEEPTTTAAAASDNGLWIAVGVMGGVVAVVLFALIMSLVYNSVQSRSGYTTIRSAAPRIGKRNNFV